MGIYKITFGDGSTLKLALSGSMKEKKKYIHKALALHWRGGAMHTNLTTLKWKNTNTISAQEKHNTKNHRSQCNS